MIAELDTYLLELPAECVYALDVNTLLQPNIRLPWRAMQARRSAAAPSC
jgi:hypothetical protein